MSRKKRRDEGGSFGHGRGRGAARRGGAAGGRAGREGGLGRGRGAPGGGEGRAEGGPMPLQRPALPGGGLYSAECRATQSRLGKLRLAGVATLRNLVPE